MPTRRTSHMRRGEEQPPCQRRRGVSAGTRTPAIARTPQAATTALPSATRAARKGTPLARGQGVRLRRALSLLVPALGCLAVLSSAASADPQASDPAVTPESSIDDYVARDPAAGRAYLAGTALTAHEGVVTLT